MIGCDPYFGPGESEFTMMWALVDFAAWCAASEGNQSGTISGKLAAVQYFHRVSLGLEIPTKLPLIKRTLQGISRSHTLAGTTPRVRLPVSWGMLLGGKQLAQSWGSGGSVLWLCLGMAYFFIMRSDEVFASASGVAHAAHCLTRGDVAFFAGEQQLGILEWHRADRVEVRFRGHKGDQKKKR